MEKKNDKTSKSDSSDDNEEEKEKPVIESSKSFLRQKKEFAPKVRQKQPQSDALKRRQFLVGECENHLQLDMRIMKYPQDEKNFGVDVILVVNPDSDGGGPIFVHVEAEVIGHEMEVKGEANSKGNGSVDLDAVLNIDGDKANKTLSLVFHEKSKDSGVLEIEVEEEPSSKEDESVEEKAKRFLKNKTKFKPMLRKKDPLKRRQFLVKECETNIEMDMRILKDPKDEKNFSVDFIIVINPESDGGGPMHVHVEADVIEQEMEVRGKANSKGNGSVDLYAVLNIDGDKDNDNLLMVFHDKRNDSGVLELEVEEGEMKSPEAKAMIESSKSFIKKKQKFVPKVRERKPPSEAIKRRQFLVGECEHHMELDMRILKYPQDEKNFAIDVILVINPESDGGGPIYVHVAAEVIGHEMEVKGEANSKGNGSVDLNAILNIDGDKANKTLSLVFHDKSKDSGVMEIEVEEDKTAPSTQDESIELKAKRFLKNKAKFKPMVRKKDPLKRRQFLVQECEYNIDMDMRILKDPKDEKNFSVDFIFVVNPESDGGGPMHAHVEADVIEHEMEVRGEGKCEGNGSVDFHALLNIDGDKDHDTLLLVFHGKKKDSGSMEIEVEPK